jgi:hypothetical protein
MLVICIEFKDNASRPVVRCEILLNCAAALEKKRKRASFC